jgi:hypothetical protein
MDSGGWGGGGKIKEEDVSSPMKWFGILTIYAAIDEASTFVHVTGPGNVPKKDLSQLFYIQQEIARIIEKKRGKKEIRWTISCVWSPHPRSRRNGRGGSEGGERECRRSIPPIVCVHFLFNLHTQTSTVHPPYFFFFFLCPDFERFREKRSWHCPIASSLLLRLSDTRGKRWRTSACAV